MRNDPLLDEFSGENLFDNLMLCICCCFAEENSETEDEDDDNDQSSIRAMLPAPSEIRNMTNEEAMERLRSLLPDNMLAEQLEAVSNTFIL